jgi:NitT/TauT family transport system ATP-binding protein/nitrate/nitrite transport system substrate-binding protein
MTMTIGMLRLTDAAPVIVAKELGFYVEAGLDVKVQVEPSWANIADKLTFGRFQAAVMLPPLALAMVLGLRGARTDVIVPLNLSLNGNSITMSLEIADQLMPAGMLSDGVIFEGPLDVGGKLAALIARTNRKLRFAVVHKFSTHNFLLRYWLAASGIDPSRDVEINIVPPADAVQAMRNGEIDGFCVGAPWGEIAARCNVGRTLVVSSQIWRNHPEKCLAVKGDWASANPGSLQILMTATLRGSKFCDAAENAALVAEILSRPEYLGIAPDAIRTSLPGQAGRAPPTVDTSCFHANSANFPFLSHAGWFLEQMKRWDYVAPEIQPRPVIDAVYRPDLFRGAAGSEALPRHDDKQEGGHRAPWMLEGSPLDIPMQPDGFCDGAIFKSAR